MEMCILLLNKIVVSIGCFVVVVISNFYFFIVNPGTTCVATALMKVANTTTGMQRWVMLLRCKVAPDLVTTAYF